MNPRQRTQRMMEAAVQAVIDGAPQVVVLTWSFGHITDLKDMAWHRLAMSDKRGKDLKALFHRLKFKSNMDAHQLVGHRGPIFVDHSWRHATQWIADLHGRLTDDDKPALPAGAEVPRVGAAADSTQADHSPG